MPFQSEKQRRYLWANEPEIARDWADTYGSRIEKNSGGLSSLKTNAPKGEFLAYINSEEAKVLKALGGAGKKVNGVPSFEDPDATGWSAADHGPTGWSGDPGVDAEESQPISNQDYKGPLISGDYGQVHGGDPTKTVLPSRTLTYPSGRTTTRLEPRGGNWFTNALDYGARGLYNKIPNKFSWTYDKRQKFMKDKLTEAQRASLGYDFSTNWDDLSDEEKEQLMSYDVYSDLNRYGYQDWLRTQNTGGGGGGDGGGYMGYPSYAAWKAAQGQGGTTKVAEVVEDTPSAFQASLTGTADTPNYYVGENPLASNIAWGKQFGVDPRTMGLTSYAADGGRIPAAYGGIMDSSTGRRAYGLGSFFKSVKNATKKVLKSDLGKAALIGTAMYGANAGWFGGLGEGWVGGLKTYAKNNPWVGNMLLNKEKNYSLAKLGIWAAGALPFFMGGGDDDDDDKDIDYDLLRDQYAQRLMNIKAGVRAGTLDPNEYSYLPSNYTYTGAEGGRAGYYAGGQSTPSDYTMEDAMMTTTQDKLGGITDVMKQADLNRQGSVGQFYASHGGSADDKLMARIKELQDEGLDYNSARAQAEKEAQGKAQGGRIGYDAGGQTGHPPITMGQIQAPPQMPAPPPRPNPMPAPQPNRMAGMNPMMRGMNPMMNRPMMRGMNPMMGGRRMAQEGGLMDLGGMEKDYRQEGGFVPLGGEEKADDVPARLSKNEFVFTADAVRAAGGGDVDAGAEIMENVMENLEQGGQISEESQGLAGAQEMFGVSERLSEVV